MAKPLSPFAITRMLERVVAFNRKADKLEKLEIKDTHIAKINKATVAHYRLKAQQLEKLIDEPVTQASLRDVIGQAGRLGAVVVAEEQSSAREPK